MTTRIYNFFEASASFTLAPLEAIEHFLEKGLKPTFAWQEMIAEEHDLAFTVAKMMDTDLLRFVQNKTTEAVAGGITLEEYKAQLIPDLQKAGWWGKKDMIDPDTGQVVEAQLGSASRLETIFRSNLQSAYAAGNWQQIKANAETAPYLMYDAIEDYRVRPEHLQWNGKVIPADDPFWQQHFPPNGWNCRCGVVQMDGEEMRRYGMSVTTKPKPKLRVWVNPRTGKKHMVSESVDPGWDHNPGIGRAAYLRELKREKNLTLLADQQRALEHADSDIAKAQQAHLTKIQSDRNPINPDNNTSS